MEALQTNTRIALRNILVTTDFSDVSKAALPFAGALARQYEAKIIVAHAVSPEPHLSVPLDPLPKDADPAFLEAQAKLEEFALGNSLGVRPAEMFLERGDVWDVVSDIIQKNKIDLVVTGTHGRQGLRKLVLGSDAEKIYRKGNLPRTDDRPSCHSTKGHKLEARNYSFPHRRLRDFPESSSLCLVSGRRESGDTDFLTTDAHGSHPVSGI
jgi:nucleotide-binding universal stress UspA family protein